MLEWEILYIDWLGPSHNGPKCSVFLLRFFFHFFLMFVIYILIFIKVWDRRSLSEEYPKPVGMFAGHTDGITYICAKVFDVVDWFEDMFYLFNVSHQEFQSFLNIF